MATLFGTPIIRSLFVVGAFMFFSFGLWNVLLLPFSLQVLGATEFQYGLQEGLTSVGFVAGSFFMARFSRLLPEPVWIIVAMIGMGVCRRPVRPVDPGRGRDRPGDDLRLLQLAVVDRALGAAPAQHARARCAVASSRRSTSCATSSSCSGWPAPGLADIVDIRLLIIFASSLLFVSAAFTFVAPGLGRLDVARRGRSPARVRGGARHSRPARSGPPRWPTSICSPGGSAHSRGSRRSSARRSCEGATVRDVPSGTRIVEHGDAASSAYFILDGSTTAGIPTDDGYRGLSTMTAGDFFGEIGGADRQPADRRRGGRHRHDPARGPGRGAARYDERAGDPASSSCRR